MIPYCVVFIIMYSLVSSLPTQPYPTADMYRKNYETDDWSKEPSSNDTRSIRSKMMRLLNTSRGLLGQANKGTNSEMYSKNGIKRGLDIGVHVKLRPTQKYRDTLNELEDALGKALGLEGGLEQAFNSSSCPKCDEEEEEIPGVPARHRVKPAFECDDWDSKLRLCVLERNIGDTVTFYLSSGKSHTKQKPNITWKKEFHMQNSETRIGFVIDPETSPQNMIIGKQGYELRVSPITEIDVGYNLFSATIAGHFTKQSKVYFVIRTVPIDLGFVYVGETIELNLRSYISLPTESLVFRWYMEKYGEHGTLPSNMRTSISGSSIKISELRQEQEGVLACSVYTNLHFLATKKRFLVKDLIKNKDVLQSAPDHDLVFKEQAERLKRYPIKLVRHKRYLNIDDAVERALESTSTEEHAAETETTSRSYDNYDLDIGKGEPQMKTFEDFENSDFDSQYQDSNQDPGRHSQPVKKTYISAENSNVEMEVPGESNPALDNSEVQNIKEEKSPRLEASVINQPERKPFRQYSSRVDELPKEQASLGYEVPPEQMSRFSKKSEENVNKLLDMDTENRKGTYQTDSQIILNIDKIPGPRRTSSEENIAKLISFCYTDFECSATATCVRTNLKQKGFCKCLPGYYGIGIFCREDIWLSKRNFDMEELRNPEDIPYTSFPPAFQEDI